VARDERQRGDGGHRHHPHQQTVVKILPRRIPAAATPVRARGAGTGRLPPCLPHLLVEVAPGIARRVVEAALRGAGLGLELVSPPLLAAIEVRSSLAVLRLHVAEMRPGTVGCATVGIRSSTSANRHADAVVVTG
jgi:hypothetical protein